MELGESGNKEKKINLFYYLWRKYCKMKKLVFVLVSVLSVQFVYSQTIVDFFYSLPEKYIDDLSFVERKHLVEESTLTKDDMTYHLSIDSSNGFMRLSQHYTEGQSGFGVYEITYWNLKNKQLIAVSSIMGSNAGFHQHDFKFFEYSDQNFYEIPHGYLKSYTSNFDVFINNLIGDFTTPQASQSEKEKLRYAGFTIALPQNGKDITVSFKDTYFLENEREDKYRQSVKFVEKTYRFNKKLEMFE